MTGEERERKEKKRKEKRREERREEKRREAKRSEAKRSKPCATSNSVNTDWSHLGDYLKEATAGRDDDLESDGTHIPQDLAVSVHEQENALDWLDNNQLAE